MLGVTRNNFGKKLLDPDFGNTRIRVGSRILTCTDVLSISVIMILCIIFHLFSGSIFIVVLC
jgi:hypothetical protein